MTTAITYHHGPTWVAAAAVDGIDQFSTSRFDRDFLSLAVRKIHYSLDSKRQKDSKRKKNNDNSNYHSHGVTLYCSCCR
ncbi:hypothetical protein RRG08_053659 [Elysia crispata]|uniref:Uncharacterized protein n=1 Tax=Elysia crispata TaxID=231223 RepID=A0AAE0ZPN8_9GAST|nr:hypothetical protein RRG08_053659 [Elysia crispata]